MPGVPRVDFDFKVHMSVHTVAARPGQTVAVPVAVQAVKGGPQPVVLTASDWSRSAGLRADIAPSTVASGGSAVLYVAVPAGAPAGSYFYTVRGDAEGTFKTSNDTVTVVVAPEEEGRERRAGLAGSNAVAPMRPA